MKPPCSCAAIPRCVHEEDYQLTPAYNSIVLERKPVIRMPQLMGVDLDGFNFPRSFHIVGQAVVDVLQRVGLPKAWQVDVRRNLWVEWLDSGALQGERRR